MRAAYREWRTQRLDEAASSPPCWPHGAPSTPSPAAARALVVEPRGRLPRCRRQRARRRGRRGTRSPPATAAPAHPGAAAGGDRPPLASPAVRAPSEIVAERRARTGPHRPHRPGVALVLFLTRCAGSPASTPTTSGSTRSACAASSGACSGEDRAGADLHRRLLRPLLGQPLIADRVAPRFRPAGPEEDFVERYQELVGRRAGLVRIGVSLLFGLIAGVGGVEPVERVAPVHQRVDFGLKDPQFGTDVGFYVFSCRS